MLFIVLDSHRRALAEHTQTSVRTVFPDSRCVLLESHAAAGICKPPACTEGLCSGGQKPGGAACLRDLPGPSCFRSNGMPWWISNSSYVKMRAAG